jgi:hypothetical protein
MTLDELIYKLQTVQNQVRQCGRNPEQVKVLFRDKSNGFLHDEVDPWLTEVYEHDLDSMTAFDMQVGDIYLEL